ncbi:class IV adenylate cyclase [Acidianus sp. HS-5]|uniref:class IV adenylate cyclase n=1 Tax=Acidianus sp. HS-5 TaxID=2886040 RepID=UPI001F3FC061|nr:class IV adenylate cyclase [Acidianus sp. HS-5]
MTDIIEREVKLKLESPTLTDLYNKLLGDGIQFIRKETEEDIYFNTEFRDFRKTDEALRIRKTDTGIEFTYKGPKIGKLSKSREEITVTVNNTENLIKILEKLGIKPAYTVVKNRIFLRDSEFIICLDTVKDLGEFIEIEIPNSTEEKLINYVNLFLEKYKIKATQIKKSYLELLVTKNEKNDSNTD